MWLMVRLAYRNLLRNPKRTVLTVVLISMSLVAVMFTHAMVIGMEQNMIKSATRLFSGDAQIHHREYRQSLEPEFRFEYLDLLQDLDQEAQLEAVTARLYSPGMLSSSGNVLSVQMIGIMPERERLVSKIGQAVVEGEYLTGDSLTEIMLGYELADQLEVDLGDRVVLSVPQLETGDVQQELFRVSGIFRFNSRFLDESLVMLALPRAQALINAEGTVQEVAFNFREPGNASDPNQSLWAKYSTDTLEAQGWLTLLPQLAGMLELTNFSTLIVGVLLYIIAALGVVNAMFMSIYERIWEFGVVKAIGNTPLNLFSLILLEATMLALISLMVGMVLGTLLNLWVADVGIDYSEMDFYGVAIVEPIRTVLDINQYTTVPLIVFLLTLLSCIYPAVFAARIVPAQALHKSL